MKAIKGKWLILSWDEVREDSAVLIENGRVYDIVSNASVDGLVEKGELLPTEVEDRRDCILFPGFVNAHMHQYGILSHGIPQAGQVTDFESFLREYWWPYIENRIRKEQVLVTAKASIAEMIHSGITSFCDILEAPYTEEDTLIAQGNLIESCGMRGVVSLESSERISLENGKACLKQNREAAEYFQKKGGTVRGAVCTHTTFTCSGGLIREAAKMAGEQGFLLQFHLSESRYEPEQLMKKQQISPTELYFRENALGENTIATQCVKVSEEEMKLLKETKTGVVHMPISNCEVGGGIAPVPEMLDGGIRSALGTDGYVNDFFQVMRMAFLIHKAALESTETMPAALVFRMATEYGADVCGFKGCGRLQKGCQADVVVYEDRQPTPVTEGNIFDQLVVYGNSSNVRDVYVQGKEIMKNHEILTMDEKESLESMRVCAENFWREIH